MSRCWLLSAPLKPAVLWAALQDVVAGQTALRTTFVADHDTVRCVTHPRLPADVAVLSAPSLAQCLEAVRSHVLRALDVGVDSPVRARLFQLTDGRQVLLLVVHHLVFDAWSAELLLTQLDHAYRRRDAGREPEPTAPVEPAWPEPGAPEFWCELLAGRPDRLPSLRPSGPVVRSGTGTVLRTTLAPELADGLQTLARRLRVTPFAAYLTAVRLTLHRWSGRPDLVLSTPVAHRTDPDTAESIGLFSTAVPLRCALRPRATVAETICEQAWSALDAFDHPPADPAALLAAGCLLPDVEVSFACSTVDGVNTARLGGVAMTALEHDVGSCHADLSVEVLRGAAHTEVRWTFDPESFAAGPVQRLTQLLPETVAAMLDDPDGACEHTATPPETVLDRIDALADQQPDAPAVVCGSESLSYAALVDLSLRMAGNLAGRRAEPGRPIAIVMRRSAAQVAAMLAVLRVRAPYLCLDETAAPARLTELLRRADVGLAVVDADIASALTGPVELLDAADAASGARQDSAGTRPGPLDLAYLLYTSGSTGEPKAVPIGHEGLAAYSAAVRELVGIAGASYACVSALSTDLGNTAVFGALTSGGCLHLVDPEVYRDPFEFADYLHDHRVDVLKITPSHLEALLEAGDDGVLPSRVLICGGEKLPWPLADAVLAGGRRLINHYGPTEATVGCLAYEVRPGDPLRNRADTVPIGTPLGAAEVRLADPAGAAVPPGADGEIWISGPAVSGGYWRRPDLTEAAFATTADKTVWYRTGDRARALAGGELEFRGRWDDQVKIRGYRVEPAEAEAALAALPGVARAAVLVAPTSPPRLVGYVVARPGHHDTGPELRSRLRQLLPEQLVPASITVLENLPLLPSGKLDRQTLLADLR